MRVLLLLLAMGVSMLSCATVSETLVETGVEITAPQAQLTFSAGDTLQLEVCLRNVSDTAIEIYIGEAAFWLVDLRGIEYTWDNLWAHNIGQKPHLCRVEADSQVTLALRFVEVLQEKTPKRITCKVWYRYSWVGEGEAYRYSIVSRDPIVIEVIE